MKPTAFWILDSEFWILAPFALLTAREICGTRKIRENRLGEKE
jgi:hypothetical protein